MSRPVVVAGAQLGPIGRHESRRQVVARLIALMRKAKTRGAQLVVFPELALTTFFPRWYFEDEAELDAFFETEMPGPAVQPLFEAARELQIGFYLGYAELSREDDRARRFNTSILVDANGTIVGKYRKMHLPGHEEYEPHRPFQHLEKRYFEPGNLGFGVFSALGGRVGMAICNDRRWPETYRMHALQGAEMLVLGYNTPIYDAVVPEHNHLQGFHNRLSLQAGAYQNGLWVVGVAKAGREEGCDLLGQSCIVAPTGEIVAMASTLGDELIVHECDLDRIHEIRTNIFDFARHRRPREYALISQECPDANA